MVDPALVASLAGVDALADAATSLHPTLSTTVGFDLDLAGSMLAQETTNATNATTAAGTVECSTVNESQTTNATTTAGASPCVTHEAWWDFKWLESVVETATGWAGLGIIAVYSFLIAIVLPLPSEVVLAAPLKLGLPPWTELGLIMLVSGIGKAIGSVLAFHLGQEAKESGPVISFLRRSRFDVVAWSEKQTVEIAKKYGYVGLAMALCVPGFPDTLSIYAFSVLEEDYVKFAAATFAGSVGRLLLWAAGAEAVLAFI